MKNKIYVFKEKLIAIKLILKASVMVITDDWHGGYIINLKTH